MLLRQVICKYLSKFVFYIFFYKGEIMRAVHFYHKAYSLDNGKIVSMVNAARGLRHIGKLEEAHHVLNQLVYNKK